VANIEKGLINSKKSPQKQTNPEKTENEKERIKRGGEVVVRAGFKTK
jgi:hypothetical protein